MDGWKEWERQRSIVGQQRGVIPVTGSGHIDISRGGGAEKALCR